MKKLFLSTLLITGISLFAKAQIVDCGQAALWVGQKLTVCGQIKSAQRDTLGKNTGMLLGICVPYPHQPLMIIVVDQVLPTFPYDETDWIGKQVCVSGLIEVFHGNPYIKVLKRTQLIID